MRKRTFLITLMIVGFFFQFTFPLRAFAQEAGRPPAPTVFEPSWGLKTENRKPLIRGVTVNNTRVAVYIDGVFNGFAETENDPSGTASFVYIPFHTLSVGMHYIQTRAENREKPGSSQLSPMVAFEVIPPYPAPTLFQPMVNDNTNKQQPFIVGVVKNNSYVRIFIDDKLNGTIYVQGEKDVVDFAYKPFLELDPDQGHIVYAVATDGGGRESAFSNVTGFLVKDKDAEKKVTTTQTQKTTPVESEEAVEETEVATEETEEEVPSRREAPKTETAEEVTEEENSEKVTDEETTEEEERAEGTTEDTADETEETLGEETDQDEEVKAEEEATTTNEEQQDDRSWFIWVVVILIILIILFRSRDRLGGRGGGRAPSGGDTRATLGKIIEQKDTTQPSGPPKESGEEKKDTTQYPPSPPPSSGY